MDAGALDCAGAAISRVAFVASLRRDRVACSGRDRVDADRILRRLPGEFAGTGVASRWFARSAAAAALASDYFGVGPRGAGSLGSGGCFAGEKELDFESKDFSGGELCRRVRERWGA